MISNEEAHSYGWKFNYTAEEWAAITKQVARISVPNEPFDFHKLLEAANIYLDECFRSPRELVDSFGDIAKSAERLRRNIFKLECLMPMNCEPAPNRYHDALSELAYWARNYEAVYRVSWPSRWRFYNTVLECWGDAGGRFKRSRKKPVERDELPRLGGSASGPTVLYVEAAVTPVMGEEAPGREAICKLIVRHRERGKKI